MASLFHKQWLKATAVIIGSFGPVFFLGTMPNTSGPARLTLDLLGWRWGQTAYQSADIHFLSALTGGFLFGWGVMVWCLSSWVYDKAPEEVRRSVVSGLLAWFTLDSAGSIAAGAWPNALFNILVLLIGVGPLWRPARA